MRLKAFLANIYFSKTLHKNCPYLELFWSVFSCIQIEYGEIWSISPYSVRKRENADQNNAEYGHFSRSKINNRVNRQMCEIFPS